MPEPITTPAIQLRAACHRTVIPAGEQAQVIYFLAEVLPDPSLARAPANLALVLDRSGIMLEESLPGIKQALRDLVEQLQPQDALSVVTADGEVIIPAQPARDRAALNRLIDRLAAQNAERSCAGLAEGLRQAAAGALPERVSRLVYLLGGETSGAPQEFEALAGQAAQAGLPLVAIGVGSAWSETLLSGLADRSLGCPPGAGLGTVEHVRQPEDIAEAARDVYDLLFVKARRLELTLHLARGLSVRSLRQVSPLIRDLEPAVQRGAGMTAPVGDLPHCGLAFLAEVLAPPRAPGPARLVQLEASCRLPDGEAQRVTSDLVVTFAPETGGTNPLDSTVMDYVEAAQAWSLNLQAIRELDAGSRQAAAQKLRQAAAILISQGRHALADRIRGEADYNIRQYGQVSNEGRKLILYGCQHPVRSLAAGE
ncbi:MAG: VWA domain-containing protein [Chloroflexota bacterium]